ncbi:MAG: DUF87 domain-containing protein [Bacteroidales bacterium]|nr:DUF87 domain-containing protein [Bacteroidales bacterium]
MSNIEVGLFDSINSSKEKEARDWFKKLIQPEQYVGELYSINYETAKVIIHNFYRQKVGGIASLSFLIATRINPNDESEIDFTKEDSSIILLRVMDSTMLPQDVEAERIRVETAQRVSGEDDKQWDVSAMDARTKNLFDFAGLQCRIIGTFFLDENPNNSEAPLSLKFGSDISNYYPNRGLKVYKPTSSALEEIINYCDPVNIRDQKDKFNNIKRVKLGNVRYASTNRRFQHVDDVPVYIYPSDLLSQKSALFGMTRTGKSNTTKIIAKSVYELRMPSSEEMPLRIGQLVFDPNGEYANENVQDNNSALKNVWKLISGAKKENEVVTYGITSHPNDADRKMMLINFYLEDNILVGKDIINNILVDDTTTYIKNFVQANLNKPENEEPFGSDMTRYKRRILAYRSVLNRAGFPAPANLKPDTKGLFNKELRTAMNTSTSDDALEYQSASKIFESSNATWDQIGNAFEALDKFIRDPKSGYKDFENNYVNRPNGSGDRWADEDLKKIIGIFQYPNGTRKIGKAILQHSANTSSDYADDIYKDLKDGKLVIVDQSCGDPELNKSSSYRIITKIFKNNQQRFVNGDENIPEILVYIEEAHNILPAGNDLDTADMWVRTAKEGAKYRIGMVYATQEVSSIQKNILKNTSNWFISHLNNTDETRELCKYYDFADFEPSIRRAQDKGFLRVKTLSNLFVIPVQVDKFEI